MSIAVEFLDVVKQFPGAVEPAVDHVSFQIQEQEMITILGTSGCGKTTLMKMVNRLYEPTSGEIRIFGENIGQTDAVALRRKIGYVIQQVGLFPHMTVEKNIAVVPEILGWDSAQIHDRVTELLELVNLDPKQYRGRYPSQLSGGQQQRVAIARALVNNPKIILADEPTGALDSRSGIQVMNLFQQLNEEGVTIIMITHDANIANHAKKVLHIFDGEIVEDKARKEKEKQQSEIRSEAAESVSSELEKDFGVNAWEGEI